MKTKALPTSITAMLMPAHLSVVEQLALELSETMRVIHGGIWRVQIDHTARIVIVVPHIEHGGA